MWILKQCKQKNQHAFCQHFVSVELCHWTNARVTFVYIFLKFWYDTENVISFRNSRGTFYRTCCKVALTLYTIRKSVKKRQNIYRPIYT